MLRYFYPILYNIYESKLGSFEVQKGLVPFLDLKHFKMIFQKK